MNKIDSQSVSTGLNVQTDQEFPVCSLKMLLLVFSQTFQMKRCMANIFIVICCCCQGDKAEWRVTNLGVLERFVFLAPAALDWLDFLQLADHKP